MRLEKSGRFFCNGCQMKHFKDFLDVAALWADSNDIPINIWRQIDDSWALTMRFRDSEGWYSMLVPVTNVSVCGTHTMAINLITLKQHEKHSPNEPYIGIDDQIRSYLRDKARQARKARIKHVINIKQFASNQHAHPLPV